MKTKFKYLFIIFLSLFILFIFYDTSFAENTLNISSPCAILIDLKTGKIIYEKNSSQKMYPASTTKVMTAILTLENTNLTDIATVSENAVSLSSVPDGYTRAHLVTGEKISIEDLLNVLLIPSANDAAIVLAEHISGSIEKFADKMNEKAKEIGCKNTNFTNPNGVHDDNEFTTAYDLSLIGKYAMHNEIFRNIVSKTKFTLPQTNEYKNSDREFKTTNELLKQGEFYYPYATGVKTGYTEYAKCCIISSAKNEDKEFLAVILGADDETDGMRETDCINLFNFAFKNYSDKIFLPKNKIIKQIELETSDHEKQMLDIISENEIKVTTTTLPESLTPQINIKSNLKAPILKDSILGTISYTIDGITYTSNLIAGNNILDSNSLLYIFIALSTILLILIFTSIFQISKHKKKNKNEFLIKFYRN